MSTDRPTERTQPMNAHPNHHARHAGPAPARKPVDVFAVIALCSAVLGLFVLSIFFGPIAFITGCVGATRDRASVAAVIGAGVGIVETILVVLFLGAGL